MQSQENTTKVTHKKNGVQREFTDTQLKLMGKQNRKMFKSEDPAEAGDVNAKVQETELEQLRRENAELIAARDAAKAQAPVIKPVVKSDEELEAEFLRAENNRIKSDVSSVTSNLATEPVVLEDEDEDEGEDPNPELTTLRAQYTEATGKRPGRMGTDKMQEAIAASVKQ